MAIYFMFGKYTHESIKKAKPARTKKVNDTIKKLGGKIKSIHALLGQHDLVIIADFPDNKKAMKASVTISRELGIGLSTSPAVDVKEFDKLLKGQ